MDFPIPIQPYDNIDFHKTKLVSKETGEELPGVDMVDLSRQEENILLKKDSTIIVSKAVFETRFDISYFIIEGEVLMSEQLKDGFTECQHSRNYL